MENWEQSCSRYWPKLTAACWADPVNMMRVQQFSSAHNARGKVVPHGRAAVRWKTIRVEIFGKMLQLLIILDCCVIGIEHVNDAANVGLDGVPYFEAVISVVVVR